jgi:hypothetical protein
VATLRFRPSCGRIIRPPGVHCLDQ